MPHLAEFGVKLHTKCDVYHYKVSVGVQWCSFFLSAASPDVVCFNIIIKYFQAMLAWLLWSTDSFYTNYYRISSSVKGDYD